MAATDMSTAKLYSSIIENMNAAVVLLVGLPVAVLVYGLFGQTGEIIATFAWILAASFVATGLLLVASATLQAREPG